MIMTVKVDRVDSDNTKFNYEYLEKHSGVYKMADNYFISFGNGVVLSVAGDGKYVVSPPSPFWMNGDFKIAREEVTINFKN